jgi:hypothetical protein
MGVEKAQAAVLITWYPMGVEKAQEAPIIKIIDNCFNMRTSPLAMVWRWPDGGRDGS